MADLKIKNLTKSFGDRKVLDNINLSINDGEFIVLVGPSGSGKSTILRIISGLEEPTEGEIEINSKPVMHLKPKDRDIAMVFQNYALYPHMTVSDNISFPLKMRGMNKDVINKAVLEVTRLLGLESYLRKKPKELSGGERQRVALGRAIVRKPKLFLMDEPLSNLDARLRTQMRSELLKLHKSLAATFIYVTHDQIEALTMGTRIAVLDGGRIKQIGTPTEIYNNPADTFVAGFIGSPGINFFPFKLLKENKILFYDTMHDLRNNIPILMSLYKENFLNKEILLGIRPEHLTLTKSEDLSFESTVELVEMLGNEYLIYFKQKENTVNLSIKLSDHISAKRGDKVTISINFSKALFFNKDTGRRIYI